MADAQRSEVIQNDPSQFEAFKNLTRHILRVPKQEANDLRVQKEEREAQEKEREQRH